MARPSVTEVIRQITPISVIVWNALFIDFLAGGEPITPEKLNGPLGAKITSFAIPEE